MTPNELRIGDYVRIKDSGEIVKVCAITNKEIGFHASGDRRDGQLRYRRLSEIEPIPIYEIKDSLPICPTLFGANKHFYLYNGIKRKYLHELQNVYYVLNGKELEVKLWIKQTIQ